MWRSNCESLQIGSVALTEDLNQPWIRDRNLATPTILIKFLERIAGDQMLHLEIVSSEAWNPSPRIPGHHFEVRYFVEKASRYATVVIMKYDPRLSRQLEGTGIQNILGEDSFSGLEYQALMGSPWNQV